MSGLIWVVLGVGLCIGSVKLRIGDFHNPGPGFMPFLSSILLVLVGIVLSLQATSKKVTKELKGTVKKFWFPWNRKESFFSLFAILGYIFFLYPLGFLFTTFFFLFFLFKLTEPKKWLSPLSFSLLLTILTYLIFSVWLNCQFPRGIFKEIIK